jgi:hypothetical protein
VKKSRRIRFASIALGLLGVFAIVAPGILYWHHSKATGSSQESIPWAEFGEYFGGISGPLIALAALFALAITLYLQAVELESTQAALDKQAFEGTFFQLLKQFRDVAGSAHIAGRPGTNGYDGRLAFFWLYASLKNKYMPSTIYPSLPVGHEDEAKVLECYRSLYRDNEPELGPYFRSLYHVFKFIDESTQSTEDKERYASIARAQLSMNETLLLFYNGTWSEGQKFRVLIEKYGILKHVPRDHLLRPDHLEKREWYAVSAFQSAEDRGANSPLPSSVNARAQ